ncbi:MAG: site-specific tyrosine recombinase XerD [Candidatus Doudnabacteria bacterium]
MLIQVIAIEYLRYLQFDCNFKDITKRRYRLGSLVMFWLHKEVESLTYKDVTDFVETLKNRNCKPRYINAYLSVIRVFLRFCIRSEIKVINPKEIKDIRVPKTMLNYLTPHEVKKFLELMEGDTITTKRNRAIMTILFDTGMRISECLSLQRSQLDNILKGECSIVGKNGNERQAFFTWSRPYIQEYVDSRLKEDTCEALFSNYCNGLKYKFKPLQAEPFRKTFRKLRAKFGKFFILHDARRTAATHWKESGMDLYDVSKILGHANVGTTQKYYLGTDWVRLKSVHTKHSEY